VAKTRPALLQELIVATPDVMGGRPVFRNTRVPVEILFENLADGLSLDEVLEAYPTLDRDDVVAVLEQMPAALGVTTAA
jgi:uncharacterized protein (DUF433 family)